MGVNVKTLAGLWMAALLSVAGWAAPGPASSPVSSNDLRLVKAAKEGDKEAVRSLLQQQVDANAPESDGATALHWTAHRGDMETADLLLRAGANASAANEYGVTPLALACTNRNDPMVKRLLEAGADPNAAKGTGETVLMTCSWTGSVEAVKALLAHGADVNAKESRWGQTALMWALAGKHSDTALVLMENGADTHARSKAIALPESAYRKDTGGVGLDNSDRLRYPQPAGSFTPLLFAAQQGDLDSVRRLLAAGVDVNEATPEDGSALVVASASGHEALSLFLLERGANPNAADGSGVTPLHYAVGKGISALTGIRYDPSYRVQPANMPELVKALLAHGANPNAQITRGYRRGPDGIPISMIGATPVFLAAVTADAGLMRVLATAGADPRLAAQENTTPLMAAALAACSGTCTYAGGNRDNAEDARNALEAVKVAVEAGVNVNAANSGGQTAMHAAAFTGADAIVQFLADNGAEVEVEDRSGETPWSMAAGISPALSNAGLYGAHKSTADLLLKLGATPRTREEIIASSEARKSAKAKQPSEAADPNQ